jgi:hypothetical protein
LNSAPKGSRFKVTKVSPCGSAVATHEFRLYTPSLHPTVSWLSPRKTRIALPLRKTVDNHGLHQSPRSLSPLDFSFALLQSQIILRFSDLQLVAG